MGGGPELVKVSSTSYTTLQQTKTVIFISVTERITEYKFSIKAEDLKPLGQMFTGHVLFT